MKNLWFVLFLLVLSLAYAKPPSVVDYRDDGKIAQKNAAKQSQDAGDDSDSYAAQIANYKDDRVTLTNRLANYEADAITATNKIALVADAPTRLALNKIQNECDDLKKICEAQKQMIADLKRALAAYIVGR